MCLGEFAASVHIHVSLHSMCLYAFTILEQQQKIHHPHTYQQQQQEKKIVDMTVYFELISLKCFYIDISWWKSDSKTDISE